MGTFPQRILGVWETPADTAAVRSCRLSPRDEQKLLDAANKAEGDISKDAPEETAAHGKAGPMRKTAAQPGCFPGK